MANESTGSLVINTVQGMVDHLDVAGNQFPSVNYIIGNPNNVLTSISSVGSDLAIDSTNGNVYISKFIAAGANGSTWYKLGSTA